MPIDEQVTDFSSKQAAISNRAVLKRTTITTLCSSLGLRENVLSEILGRRASMFHALKMHWGLELL
jgi:hypothetical protein